MADYNSIEDDLRSGYSDTKQAGEAGVQTAKDTAKIIKDTPQNIENAKEAAKKGAEAAEKAAEKVEAAADYVKENGVGGTIRNASESVKQGAQNIAEDAKTAAGIAGQFAKDNLSREGIKRNTQNAAKAVSEGVKGATEAAKQMATKEGLQKLSASVGHAAAEGAKKAGKAAGRAAVNVAKDTVKRTIMAIVGPVLGLIFMAIIVSFGAFVPALIIAFNASNTTHSYLSAKNNATGEEVIVTDANKNEIAAGDYTIEKKEVDSNEYYGMPDSGVEVIQGSGGTAPIVVTTGEIAAFDHWMTGIKNAAKSFFNKAEHGFQKTVNKATGETVFVEPEVDDIVTDDQLDKFRKAGKIEDTYKAYVDIINAYLEKAITDQRNKFLNLAAEKGWNEDLTAEAFDAQGNPFASVNYPAIMAAYGCTDDYSNESDLAQFCDYLNEAIKHDKLLTFTYVEAEKKNVIPVEVPLYKEKTITVKSEEYYGNLSASDPELKKAVIFSINQDINKNQNDIEEYQAQLKKLKTVSDQNSADYKTHYNEIQDEIDAAKNLKAQNQQKLKNVKNGDAQISASMITSYQTKYHHIKVYEKALNDDGSQEVGDFVTDEEGKYEPKYEEVTYGGKKYYKLTGQELIKPEIEYIKYGKPTLNPFKSTDVFNIFDLNPEDTWLPKGDQLQNYDSKSLMTIQQRYNEYYVVLQKQFDHIITNNFVTSIPLSGGCTITADTINGILSQLPADLSGNRKQFIKTGLQLVGAVPYQMGGGHGKIAIGWDPNWGSATGDSRYPRAGLDCSGFVRWTAQNAFNGYGLGDRLTSSDGDRAYCTPISHDQLIPGDLGFKTTGDIGHVGIYIGRDADGKDIWLHENASHNNVSIDHFKPGSTFNAYGRIPDQVMEGSDYWTEDLPLVTNSQAMQSAGPMGSTDELYLVTKVLIAECDSSKNLDGFRAVAEAAENGRIHNGYSSIYECLQKNPTYMSGLKTVQDGSYSKYHHEPTQQDYDIVNDVIAGNRKIWTDPSWGNKVMYWRGYGKDGKLIMLGPPYVFVGNYVNNFFYIP